ncbi:hypothetical protein [Phreatobacter stygius]|uniref:Uncharacterized protein n=1 Tax=Phreatobacter stygius TaxID=1940610 RepID=A0A4D7B3C5_9HYPH|nr:hypothetical protein [Phreatobacter stygius]QCI64096.1 hypothetical protein E8M01_07465 [Phreatobacter stygius]
MPFTHFRATAAGLAMAAAVLVAGTGAASACDRGEDVCSFRLINNTSVELHSFWASPPSVSNWENDILGDSTLGAGRSININMSDGRPNCVYDFKFRFADGDIVEKRRINICRLGRYTLNE